MVGGNWPAKVGAALLVIGMGALLRYAMLHVHVPPTLKLISGALASAALFVIAHLVRTRFARRAIVMDFGSLGELTNILAVIGAGLVFLLVSWLAPLPPQRQPAAASAL